MHAPLIEASDALFAQAEHAGLGALDMAAVLEVVRAGPGAAGRRCPGFIFRHTCRPQPLLYSATLGRPGAGPRITGSWTWVWYRR
ncbi:hypothetical protein G6F46_015116 [Rhizopus delemar]|nr:hypothetical protein G6F46_015116 [Rhizopus delemar]